MKANACKKLALAAVISTLTGQLQAQQASPSNDFGGLDYSGVFAPSLFFFDYFDGLGSDRTSFLERYNYQRGFGGDNRSGVYADAGFRVVGSNGERDVFVLERQAYGAYNHRQKLGVNTAQFGVNAYYTDFRSSSGGLKYLYSPNQIAGGVNPANFFPAGSNTNSGFVAQFNDDSGQTRFGVDRATYGVGAKLKPGAFNADGAIALNYDGYTRDGNRMTTYVLGGSNVTGSAARVLQRWRGFDMPINETMNRATLTASASPRDFNVSYEGSIERFENRAADFQISDFSGNSPLLVPSQNPLQFVADNTLISNNLRLSKTMGSTAIAAGYALSVLDQDSFSAQQAALDFGQGEIRTDSAFFTISANAMQGLGLEGYVKYYDRDNNSSFPVVGLVNANADQSLGVRINNIESLSMGVSGAFRPGFWRSNVIVGWRREDRDRDLTWTEVLVPGLNGIQSQRSLYSEKTLTDEVYASLVARPIAGVMLRVTPSYVWADETGLITEPEESLNLKSSASYVADAGWLLSGYVNYKNRRNGTKFFTDGLTGPVADGATTHQDVHAIQRNVGASFSKPIGEWINTSVNLAWMESDFATYFLQSSRRRFEAPNNAIAFLLRDRSNYNIDTVVMSLLGDWQVSDALSFNGGFTFSESTGETATGLVFAALPEIDGNIDNRVHTLDLGTSYVLKDRWTLNANYTFDYYNDNVYEALSGGINSVMVGVSMSF